MAGLSRFCPCFLGQQNSPASPFSLSFFIARCLGFMRYMLNSLIPTPVVISRVLPIMNPIRLSRSARIISMMARTIIPILSMVLSAMVYVVLCRVLLLYLAVFRDKHKGRI